MLQEEVPGNEQKLQQEFRLKVSQQLLRLVFW